MGKAYTEVKGKWEYIKAHAKLPTSQRGKEGRCKAYVNLMSYVKCKLDKLAIKLFRLVGPQHMLRGWPTQVCQCPQASFIYLFYNSNIERASGESGTTDMKDRSAVVSGFPARSQVLPHLVHSAHCLSTARGGRGSRPLFQ